MKKSIYALFMFVALLVGQQTQAQEKDILYNAEYVEISESWTQEGDIVENLWSLQSNCYAVYAFNAVNPLTTYLVSPEITLKTSNDVTFDHIVYESLFGNVAEEAQLVIREVGGSWVKIEGVHYPTGYDPENSGIIAIPAEFDNKVVQFAFQYKKTEENTGLWGIVNFTVVGVGGAAPDPQPEADETIYSAVMSDEFANWAQEGDYAYTDLWVKMEDVVQAYGYMAAGETTSYLVSPKMTLCASGNNVSFTHKGWYFGDMTQEAQLVIREIGGEWVKIEGAVYPEDGNYDFVNSGTLEIPAQFNGKEVQVAFQYKCNSETIGLWGLKDIKVVKSKLPVKAEAGISFDVTEVAYEIGSGDFVSPVINNPNNLKVYYSSENENVAIIDENGIVTIIGHGTALIRALSLETEEYKKGEASYTITVTDPNIVFSADFLSDLCGFKEESTSSNTAWMEGWDACVMADAYCKVQDMTDFYFISPVFTLSENGNMLSFDHNGIYFTDWEAQAQLLIREANSAEWEQLAIPTYPLEGQWVNSGDIMIPEKFNGKNVEIAFKYASDGMQNSGMWYIKNLVVRKTVPTSVNGVNVEIQDNKVYDLQGRMVENPANGIYIINGKKVIIK